MRRLPPPLRGPARLTLVALVPTIVFAVGLVGAWSTKEPADCGGIFCISDWTALGILGLAGSMFVTLPLDLFAIVWAATRAIRLAGPRRGAVAAAIAAVPLLVFAAELTAGYATGELTSALGAPPLVEVAP